MHGRRPVRDRFRRMGRFQRIGRLPRAMRDRIGDTVRAVLRLSAARPRSMAAAALTVAVAGSVALIAGLGGSSHHAAGGAAGAQPTAAAPVRLQVVSPVGVSAQELTKLPRATTFTRIVAAPLDQDPFAVTDGLVLHSPEPQVLYAGPGKQPIGVLPATELGSR